MPTHAMSRRRQPNVKTRARLRAQERPLRAQAWPLRRGTFEIRWRPNNEQPPERMDETAHSPSSPHRACEPLLDRGTPKTIRVLPRAIDKGRQGLGLSETQEYASGWACSVESPPRNADANRRKHQRTWP